MFLRIVSYSSLKQIYYRLKKLVNRYPKANRSSGAPSQTAQTPNDFHTVKNPATGRRASDIGCAGRDEIFDSGVGAGGGRVGVCRRIS